MRTQTMLFPNLSFVVGVLLLLVTSIGGGGAGDDTTQKLMSRCREEERRALLDFKANVVDQFGILSSWGTNNEEKDCCKWRGIRCSNLTGHVNVLNLPGYADEAYTNGPLTDNWVALSGKVSPSLTELKQLKYLNLSHNYFGGNIPHQLGNLTNLRSLDLGFNNYDFTSENLDWLSHLHLLKHLDLSTVDLKKSSDWLNQIYKLSSLTQLILTHCHLPDSDPSLPINNTSFSASNSLAVIDLSYNDFISPRSYNWLFNFTTSLVYVDLSFNSFIRGSIPQVLGSMLSLETLILNGCQLEGMLPNSFRNLSRLVTLDLRSNNLNGSLSKFLHPLAANKDNSLEFLLLGSNQLGGPLPDYFTRFPSLRTLSIPRNKLGGSFPYNFGQLPGLVHLDLSTNQITGSVPNITLFSSLEVLILYNNKLKDNIPEAYLSNLSKLNHLDLSLNSLSLNFSFDWVPPFQLDVILLKNCTLGPHFPNWIKSQRNYSMLDISHARISDTIPLWFWDHLPPRVRYLAIAHNNIQGILPNLSLKFDAANIVWLDTRSNNLSGPIPSLPNNMLVLDLSQNMFTGSLSFLCTTSYKILVFMDLSENQLSGELPDCWMNVHQLQTLILEKNNLSGMIPTSITLLDHLQVLQLHDNNFNGELPSSLKNCKDLILLDLSENKLSGEVPTWIGTDLTSLVVFSLRKNEFSGTLPAQICHLRNAHVLDFSQNNLSGSIPNCINNITSLVESETYPNDNLMMGLAYTISDDQKYYANAVVQWKGVASEYRNTLGLLKFIDLSSNKLLGEIPEEFASLKTLISLNLSSNNLTGDINPKIGQMKLLEILDLSRNQLSGEIPTSLASLTLLSVLDLSNNNLTGEIPSGTQLQSFDASKYAGNEQLCGLPLPNKCDDVLSPPVTLPNKCDDDDKFAEIGLYVSVVLGFGTGLWGFVGPIMFRRTWRHAYNRLLGKITDWIYITTILNMARLQRKFYG